MKMWRRWYQTAQRHRLLLTWYDAGELDAAAYLKGRESCAMPLQTAEWYGFLRPLCAGLACLLLGAAVICLVAANWAELSTVARLAGVQLLLVVAASVALLPRLSHLLRTLALLLAGMLLGGLLGLVGQTYQTGADPWQLFAGWAVLVLAWAIGAKSVVVWLFWAALGNLAIGLWASQRAAQSLHAAITLFAIFNLVLLAAWEAGWRRHAWLRTTLGPRLLATLLLSVLTWHAVLHAVDSLRGQGVAALFWWAFSALGILLFYRYVRRDVAMLALALVTVIVILTTQLMVTLDSWWQQGSGVLWLAVLAVLVLMQAAVAAAWLRRVAEGPMT